MPPVVKRPCFTLSFIVSGNISKPSVCGLSWPWLSAAFLHQLWRYRMVKWIPVSGLWVGLTIWICRLGNLQIIRNNNASSPLPTTSSDYKAAVALDTSPLQPLQRWCEEQRCPWGLGWSSWRSEPLHGAGVLPAPGWGVESAGKWRPSKCQKGGRISLYSAGLQRSLFAKGVLIFQSS